MRQARIEHFSQMTNEERLALTSDDFTISEIKEIISETPLSDLDSKIAVLRYIEKRTYVLSIWWDGFGWNGTVFGKTNA